MIIIPKSIKNIPISKLLLFSNGDFSLIKGIIKLEKKYHVLGKLDSMNIDTLYNEKGFGQKTINSIWVFLISTFNDWRSFSELVLHFKAIESKYFFKDIKCSFNVSRFLTKHELIQISDLNKIDILSNETLSNLDQLALLELKTLYFDNLNNSFSTRTNHSNNRIDLISDIDKYLRICDEKDRKLFIDRYDHKDPKSMEIIGKKYNVTRERVRQLLKNINNQFVTFYVDDLEFLKIFYFKKLIKQTTPLLFDDFKHENKVYDHHARLYEHFLLEIFTPLPIKKTLWYSQLRKSKNIKSFKQKINENAISINTVLENYSQKAVFEIINMAYSDDSVVSVFKENNEVFFSSNSLFEWEKKFSALNDFVIKNKRAPSTNYRSLNLVDGEKDIMNWYSHQKQYALENRLSEHKLNKIKEILPEFGQRERRKQRSWDEYYNDYINFKKQYNYEPIQHSNSKSESLLAQWVSLNKQRYHGTSNTNTPLSNEQYQLLTKINFNFNFGSSGYNEEETINILNDMILHINSGKKLYKHPKFNIYERRLSNYDNLSSIEKSLIDYLKKSL